MSPPGRRTTGISADELTERFQSGARVLWTLAAGLLGDPAEAEDLCQEAYLAAYAKRDRFEPGMVFAFNIDLFDPKWKDGKTGCVFAETVEITATGARRMHSYPLEFQTLSV